MPYLAYLLSFWNINFNPSRICRTPFSRLNSTALRPRTPWCRSGLFVSRGRSPRSFRLIIRCSPDSVSSMDFSRPCRAEQLQFPVIKVCVVSVNCTCSTCFKLETWLIWFAFHCAETKRHVKEKHPIFYFQALLVAAKLSFHNLCRSTPTRTSSFT